MKHLVQGFALFSVLLAASCSHGDSRFTAPVGAHATQPSQASTMTAPLFDRIRSAPLHVRHGGTRRVEFHYDSGGSPHSLVYEEHVSADGLGRFALDPLSVTTPAMTTGQREVFDGIQKQREGFFFRYRDFGVRQRDLFLHNYAIVELGTSPVVAERKCTEIQVRRIDGTSSVYVAAVDVETGLVLRCTEFGSDRRVVSKLEFTEFTLDPALDGVDWFRPRDQNETVDLSDAAAAELGFTPASPRTLPTGFQLLHSEILHEGRDVWVRRVYGDGVESLFVLHCGAHVTDAATYGTRGASGIVNALREASVATAEPLKVRLCEAGPWTLAEVVRGDDRIFVVGKIPEADVVRLLQSSL